LNPTGFVSVAIFGVKSYFAPSIVAQGHNQQRLTERRGFSRQPDILHLSLNFFAAMVYSYAFMGLNIKKLF